MRSHKFSCPLVNFSKLFFIHLRMFQSILQWWTSEVFIPLMKFLLLSFVSRHFLVLLSFISVCLMVSTFNISKFFSFSPSVLIFSQFGCSFAFVISLFPFFHYQHDVFFNAKFHSYILAVYLYCFYNNLQFFFLYCKYFYIMYVHKVINLFLWFCKFVALCVFPKYVVEWHHCYNEYQLTKRVSLIYASLDFYLC